MRFYFREVNSQIANFTGNQRLPDFGLTGFFMLNPKGLNNHVIAVAALVGFYHLCLCSFEGLQVESLFKMSLSV
jgi:hypothetical protein